MKYKTVLMTADEDVVIDPKAFDSNLGKAVPLTSCDGKRIGSATIVDVAVETEDSGRQRVVATFEVDYPINLTITMDDVTASSLSKENDW